jgi:hypothetical protein
MISLSLTDLPDDVLLEIAKQLDFQSLVYLCAVNRHCHDLFSVDNFGQIWKHLYQRDFSLLRLPESGDYRQAYAEVIRDTKKMTINQKLRYAAGFGYERLVETMIQCGANEFSDAIEDASENNFSDIYERLQQLRRKLNGKGFRMGPRGIPGPRWEGDHYCGSGALARRCWCRKGK